MKIDGSGWSKLIEPMVMKCAVSYFTGAQVAVPGDHVEGRVARRRAPEAAAELLDELVGAARRPRRPPPAPGSRAHWPGRWSRSGRARAGGTARRSSRRRSRATAPSGSSTLNATPRGSSAISPGLTSSTPISVVMTQAALLRHEQHLAIGVDEGAALHRAVGEVDVRADAGLRLGIAVGGQRVHAVDEVDVGAVRAASGASAAARAAARSRGRRRCVQRVCA